MVQTTVTTTLDIIVDPVNDAPMVAPDTNSTNEDTTLTVNAAGGVLANDSDIDGDTLTVTQFVVGGTTFVAGNTANLAEGDLTLNADGSYTFVPTTGFNGPVPTVTYSVFDGTDNVPRRPWISRSIRSTLIRLLATITQQEISHLQR